jgi:hypothetical protein
MRARRLSLALGILATLLAAPTASAAAPTTVITIDVDFITGETFTATGGVVCDSGVAVTDPVFGKGGGRQGRGVFTFHLIKTLTCDDDSGSFMIRVDAATAPTSPGTIGGFAVVGGTGDYSGLHGAGSLIGTSLSETEILDVYTGQLSN